MLKTFSRNSKRNMKIIKTVKIIDEYDDEFMEEPYRSMSEEDIRKDQYNHQTLIEENLRNRLECDNVYVMNIEVIK